MSTRGAVGIRYNNIDKIGYNHFDSYHIGLGNDILSYLNGKTIEDLKNEYNNIEIIKENKSEYDAWDFNTNTFNHKICDRTNFLKDSLFCEYAYIINLDDETLEIYHGFNKDPNEKGRYASLITNYMLENESEKRYYGVKLVKTFPLKELFFNTKKFEDDKDCNLI